ncbi:hypothetical protein E2C01_009437 [Portunus trituberculatus]|uniref:Uncharacterized protein n=1 Tax=Portunus trituberculatus TaxID=210409 RepID=A0A5B7D4T1_PORTR|nr:hypothetical protein [Portunus trituberculatus]
MWRPAGIEDKDEAIQQGRSLSYTRVAIRTTRLVHAEVRCRRLAGVGARHIRTATKVQRVQKRKFIEC